MSTSYAGMMARLSLALILMASISAASPSLHIAWSQPFNTAPNVVLFTTQTILLSSQVPYEGGYINTVQALNATFTQEWSLQSFGQVALMTTAFAFPAIPKLVFLVVNNLQPPNVTGVEPLTGVVAWSAPASFPTASVVTLLASVDGRTLYLITTSPAGLSQLTAFDAGTGDVLFSNSNAGSAAVATRCGKGGVSCVAFMGSTGNVTFLDGRNGTVVGRVTALPNFAEGTLQSLSGDQLLFSPPLSNALTVINTTSFSVMWSLQQLPSYTVISSAPYTGAKNSKHTAVVLISTSGLLGYDSRTGTLLWNSTAATVCPFSAPAPSVASGFYLEDYEFPQYAVGAMPRGLQSGDLFSFVATCEYSDDSYLTIAGAMSAVDGTTKWWRYISEYPTIYPISPVGDGYFILWSPSSNSAEFYDSQWKIFGKFDGDGNSLEGLTVVDGTVFVTSDSYPQVYLTVITVAA